MVENIPFGGGGSPDTSTIPSLILNAGNTQAMLRAKSINDLAASVAGLGQIPGQVLQQQQVKQQMALEQAKAQRDQAMTAAQMNALQREQTGQQALGEAYGQPDATPDTIKQTLTAKGRPDLIPTALKNYSDSQDAIQKHLNETRDQVGMELYRSVVPYLDKPDVLPEAVNLAGKNLVAMGLDKQGVQSTIQQLTQDPTKIGPVVQQFIAASPSAQAAMKSEKERQTPTIIPEGARAYVPGGTGPSGNQMIPASFKPGSFEATLQANHPGQDISQLPAKVVEQEKSDYEANTSDPLERALKQEQLGKLQRERTGAPGSEAHTNTFKAEDAKLTTLATPYNAIEDNAGAVKKALASNDRTALNNVQGLLLPLISQHARFNPGSVALTTSGNTLLSNIQGQLTKLSTDPNADPMPAPIKKQISDFVDLLSEDAGKKVDLINDTRHQYATTPVPAHAEISAKLQDALTAVRKGSIGGQSAPGAPPAGATVIRYNADGSRQ
jgi:hypothetical protein